MKPERKKSGPKPKDPSDVKSHAILVKYSPVEWRVLDKKRGTLRPATYVREKSLS